MEDDVDMQIKDDKYCKVLKRINLSESRISSEVYFVNNFEDTFTERLENLNLKIKVEVSKGKKCPRCWKILESKCVRCEKAITENV